MMGDWYLGKTEKQPNEVPNNMKKSATTKKTATTTSENPYRIVM